MVPIAKEPIFTTKPFAVARIWRNFVSQIKNRKNGKDDEV